MRSIAVDRGGLPDGVRRLLDLARAVPETEGARREVQHLDILERVGTVSIGYERSVVDSLDFIGEVILAFGRMMRGQARFRRSDLMLEIQQCGADALGIVALISYLVGIILAFMGAIQLSQFGAQIYVADLVGIGVTREMGAMMTAIIMAGRTGAAFAAALGTMKVTEEIDALSTMGISPLEFLVLPRMIALILMMPLLCLYSDLIAIFGGATIGSLMLGISLTVYLHETATVDNRGLHNWRTREGHRLWRAGGALRMHARISMWQQFIGGRRGDHIGGSDRNRVDRRCMRHLRVRLPRAWHMNPGSG